MRIVAHHTMSSFVVRQNASACVGVSRYFFRKGKGKGRGGGGGGALGRREEKLMASIE